MYFLSQNERLLPKPSIHNTKIELNTPNKSENKDTNTHYVALSHLYFLRLMTLFAACKSILRYIIHDFRELIMKSVASTFKPHNSKLNER